MSTHKLRPIFFLLLFLFPLPTLYSPLPAYASPPKRIVSLAPSITEILFALGLDEEIVGVTTACDYPEAAKTVAKIGDAVSPDLETLVRLRPDLIIGIRGLHRAGLSGELERLGLSATMTDPGSVQKILEDIRTIGRLVGREAQADVLTASMMARIDSVRSRVQNEPRPTILYVLWNEPLTTATSSSYIGELIELAGGNNLIRSDHKGYRLFGMEEVLLKNPEVVIFASEMGLGAAQAERERWMRWEQVAAVEENQLYVLDSDLMHRPGPRIVEAIESLADLLHPEWKPVEQNVVERPR
jgi:iron complex transport system substrate-binding protein